MLQTHGGIAGVQRTRDNEKDQDPAATCCPAGRRVGGVLGGDTDGGSVLVLVEPGIATTVRDTAFRMGARRRRALIVADPPAQPVAARPVAVRRRRLDASRAGCDTRREPRHGGSSDLSGTSRAAHGARRGGP